MRRKRDADKDEAGRRYDRSAPDSETAINDNLAAHFGKIVIDRSLRIRRAPVITAARFIFISVSFSSHNSLRPMLLCFRFTRCLALDVGCHTAVDVTSI